MKSIDLQDQHFGKWTVIEKAERPYTTSNSKPIYWRCQCACGTLRVIPSHNLRGARTHSCGECCFNLPPYTHLFSSLLYQSKKRNLKCDIKLEEFLSLTLIKKCHYCHSPVKWTKYRSRSYNLDRKNSKEGYSLRNCVVCCPRCNWGKSNRYSYEEWYEMNRCFRERTLVFIEKGFTC